MTFKKGDKVKYTDKFWFYELGKIEGEQPNTRVFTVEWGSEIALQLAGFTYTFEPECFEKMDK